MPHILEASCPKCGKVADGYDEIESMFGFRLLGGKNQPQSWCRECRGGKKAPA